MTTAISLISPRNRRLRMLAIVVWLGAAAAGMALMQRLSARAGSESPSPTRWPIDAGINLVEGRANLILFVHPLCPCSRSTMHELNEIVERANGPMSLRVYFSSPSKLPAGWARGPLWDVAAAIPGVQVLEDVDSQIAHRFGAETSGWTMLYDAGGTLRFAGGITAGRGHDGDNAGVQAILKSLGLEENDLIAAHTPVFGCALPTTQACTIGGNEQ